MSAISITPANVARVSGQIQTGTAGGTVTAGMSVYKDTSDNDHLKPADADAEASSIVEGIALHAALDGQPLSYLTNGGVIAIGGTVTLALEYYCGISTAGDIVPYSDLQSGDYVTRIGYANTTGQLTLDIKATRLAVPA